MHILTVVNIKCGGCEKKIRNSLEKAGLTNIAVDVARQTISFDGDVPLRGGLSRVSDTRRRALRRRTAG